MARRLSPERLDEFKANLAFVRAVHAFLERIHPGVIPDGTSYFDAMTAMAETALMTGAVRSEWMSGCRQAAADMLEWTRDLSPDAVRAADAFLISEGSTSLTKMRARIWRTIPKVLARGRILNLDEFYVVKNVMDDGDLPEAERSRLEALRFEFEERARRARPRRRG